MVFYHIKECYDQLIIIHGNDLVQVLSYIRENLGSWVSVLAVPSAIVLTGVTVVTSPFQKKPSYRLLGRLNTDDFDVWFQQFCQCGNTV